MCVKKSFLMVLKLHKKEKQQKFRFGGFHFFSSCICRLRMDEGKKAIGKNNQSITVRAYKRRRRLLNKTEFFIVVEQKERLPSTGASSLCVSFTPRHFASLSLQSLSIIIIIHFLIYLFDVSCIDNRNSLITFYS